MGRNSARICLHSCVKAMEFAVSLSRYHSFAFRSQPNIDRILQVKLVDQIPNLCHLLVRVELGVRIDGPGLSSKERKGLKGVSMIMSGWLRRWK